MAAASIAPSRRMREDLVTCPVISWALPLKEARECVFAAGS